jgi:hypothetical protein
MESKTKVVYEPLKRKRGRPKKSQSIVSKPKRKRGRPKKSLFDTVASELITVPVFGGKNQEVLKSENQENRPKSKIYSTILDKDPMLKVEKKKRGRPKKEKPYYDISTNEIVNSDNSQDAVSAMELFRFKQKIINKVIAAILNA